MREGSHHTDKSKEKVSKANLGKHYSPETEFKKGQKSWITGLTKEEDKRVKKISNSLRGIPKTELHKQHLRKPRSEEAKKNMKVPHPHLCQTGELNHKWRGGKQIAQRRTDAKRRGFGNVELNDKFEGSEGHHLDKELVLHIPKELHQSVDHCVYTGKGMEEINNLACEYVYGIKTEEVKE